MGDHDLYFFLMTAASCMRRGDRGGRFNYCIKEVDKIFYKFGMIHFLSRRRISGIVQRGVGL